MQKRKQFQNQLLAVEKRIEGLEALQVQDPESQHIIVCLELLHVMKAREERNLELIGRTPPTMKDFQEIIDRQNAEVRQFLEDCYEIEDDESFLALTEKISTFQLSTLSKNSMVEVAQLMEMLTKLITLTETEEGLNSAPPEVLEVHHHVAFNVLNSSNHGMAMNEQLFETSSLTFRLANLCAEKTLRQVENRLKELSVTE